MHVPGGPLWPKTGTAPVPRNNPCIHVAPCNRIFLALALSIGMRACRIGVGMCMDSCPATFGATCTPLAEILAFAAILADVLPRPG